MVGNPETGPSPIMVENGVTVQVGLAEYLARRRQTVPTDAASFCAKNPKLLRIKIDCELKGLLAMPDACQNE